MLVEHPSDVTLLATVLGVARGFCADQFDLDVLSRGSTGSTEPQTKDSWRVSDLAAKVSERRSRGVEVEEYDEPGLKTVDGIADLGFALAARLVDPHENSIGLLQFRDEGRARSD